MVKMVISRGIVLIKLLQGIVRFLLLLHHAPAPKSVARLGGVFLIDEMRLGIYLVDMEC